MSRSRRKTPIIGICGAGSQAWFRSMSWGRQRAEVRDRLITENWDIMPHPWSYGDEWDSPRDGKQYIGDDKWAKHKDCDAKFSWCWLCCYQKSMRK